MTKTNALLAFVLKELQDNAPTFYPPLKSILRVTSEELDEMINIKLQELDNTPLGE